ncbi:hypothetical protein [Lewinella sp. W8]|uniref:hypothetical protein n=1 Tax=Lewinella sp. W8 TaxID=2528208 RepID=UPI0012B5D9B8|nr:hypothetical protein [Lewinella sp. W8]MTB50257.1 hypothetical protein [Lewinella sp. W8]
MKAAFFSLWIILVAIGIAQSDNPEVELDTTPKQELMEQTSPQEDATLDLEF